MSNYQFICVWFPKLLNNVNLVRFNLGSLDKFDSSVKSKLLFQFSIKLNKFSAISRDVTFLLWDDILLQYYFYQYNPYTSVRRSLWFLYWYFYDPSLNVFYPSSELCYTNPVLFLMTILFIAWASFVNYLKDCFIWKSIVLEWINKRSGFVCKILSVSCYIFFSVADRKFMTLTDFFFLIQRSRIFLSTASPITTTFSFSSSILFGIDRFLSLNKLFSVLGHLLNSLLLLAPLVVLASRADSFGSSFINVTCLLEMTMISGSNKPTKLKDSV